MKLSKSLLGVLYCGVWVLASGGARAQDSVPLKPAELELTTTPESITVDVPAAPEDKPVIVLSFRAWLNFPTLGGSTETLKVNCNGDPLTEALGRLKTIHYQGKSGDTHSYTSNGFCLFYGPSPEALLNTKRESNPYWVSNTFDPSAFRLVLKPKGPGPLKLDFVNSAYNLQAPVKISDLEIQFLSHDDADNYRNQ